MSNKNKVVPPNADKPLTTKLIEISDACKAGCKYDDLTAVLDAKNHALGQIVELARRTNFLSEYKDGMAAITRLAEEALK